jgi:hypothetical protein
MAGFVRTLPWRNERVRESGAAEKREKQPREHNLLVGYSNFHEMRRARISRSGRSAA